MERLLDHDPRRLEAHEPDAPPALDLLRAAAPYQPPPGRKQRVRAALLARAPRRAPLLLRPVVVMGVLVGCGAIASAALGGHWPAWVRRAYERLLPAAAPSAVVASAARDHHAR